MTALPAPPTGTDPMHPNRVFHEHDPDHLIETARAHSFAIIIGARNAQSFVAHAPVMLERRDDTIILRFHLANANPAMQAIRDSGRALVVFTGPHAYISATWYEQDDQVGTWNYISVEAEGPVVALDHAGTARQLEDLSAHYEASLAPKPAWTRDQIDEQKFDRMLTAITGFELKATRFEGIRKLNQNKPVEARRRVIAALEHQTDGLEIAREMTKLEP
jgi:transcriptional regulator